MDIWKYFASIIEANGGQVSLPSPETKWADVWKPLWKELALSYGASEWGSRLAAEKAWARFEYDLMTEASAAEVNAYIRAMVRS